MLREERPNQGEFVPLKKPQTPSTGGTPLVTAIYRCLSVPELWNYVWGPQRPVSNMLWLRVWLWDHIKCTPRERTGQLLFCHCRSPRRWRLRQACRWGRCTQALARHDGIWRVFSGCPEDPWKCLAGAGGFGNTQAR